MAVDIFLIAPIDIEEIQFAEILAPALEQTYVSALFLPKGARSEEAYEAFAKAIIPVAQKHDCAVLLDNDYALAKKLKADGVHMSTGITHFKDALDALKPDLIVGAGAIHSRHDAMAKAEAGADYIFFDHDNSADEEIEIVEKIREQAIWWSETFEIPCVMAPNDPAEFEKCPSEFLAVKLPETMDAQSTKERLQAAEKALQDRQE